MNFFKSMIVTMFFKVTRTALFLSGLFVTAALTVLHPADADAATLGIIKVGSALGQPFAAEIDISGLEGDEFTQIQTRIASPETYEAAKLDYPSIVRLIRITAERSGSSNGDGGGDVKSGKAKLRLTSLAAINEPSINLLVEFTTGNGRLIQKYSVLLDLPNVRR